MQRLGAIAIIAMLTGVNLRGLNLGRIVQNVFTSAKVLSLLFIVALGCIIAPNAAAMFVPLKESGERETALKITAELQRALSSITAGIIFIVPPPPVRGIGTGGGYKMIVEDRNGPDWRALEDVSTRLIAAANQQPGLQRVFTTFSTHTPRLYADIDRERAEQLGVPVQNIFSTLGTYLGSTYINDFNFLGRTWRVTAQADAPHRAKPSGSR